LEACCDVDVIEGCAVLLLQVHKLSEAAGMVNPASQQRRIRGGLHDSE
jgi:hypothetical protein